jgi:hypothetical protein
MATYNAINNKSEPLTTSTITATGLTFDGTNTMSNFIDKGSWTPILKFGTTEVTTYSAQTGTYERFGDIVMFNIRVVVSNKGAGTGTLNISLPITPNNTFTGAYASSGSAMTTYFDTVSFIWWIPAVSYTSGYLLMRKSFMNGTTNYANATNADVGTTFTIRATGFYWV